MELRDSQKELFKNMMAAESLDSDPNCLGRLSAHLSFGKTFLMLALVRQHRVPERRRALPLRTFELMYWIPTRYIPSTLVVATKSVITQWIDHIKTYTPQLNFFVADSARELKKYENYIYDGQANIYDIVFVKTGTTKPFVPRWAGDDYQLSASSQPTINVLNTITRGLVWARLIIDDYDTLPLTTNTKTPPAYFTWLVSATWKCRKVKNEDCVDRNVDMYMFKYMHDNMFMNGLAHLVLERMTYKAVAEFTLPSITHKEYVIKPPALNRALVKGVVDNDELREAIHSGSLEKAAQMIGVEFSSPGELVAAVFQDHSLQYKQAIVALQVLEDIDWSLIFKGVSRTPKTKNNEIVNRIRIDSKDQSAEEIIKTISTIVAGYSNNVTFQSMIDELRKKMEEQRDQKLDIMHRLQDNLKIDWCMVCKVPWDDDEAQYIMTCCHITVCEDCINDGERFVKRCPNCACDVKLGEGFVRSKELLKPEDITLMVNKEEKNIYSKSDALVDYIRGVKVKHQREKTAVMEPNERLPKDSGEVVERPDEEDKRFLIYTYHTQSRREICDALGEKKIEYKSLVGNAKKRQEAIDLFKTGPSPQILVVSGAEDCAGLHLFEASHILLYHEFVNESVRDQIIGRAQRNGRKYSLEVVSFLFPDEAC